MVASGAIGGGGARTRGRLLRVFFSLFLFICKPFRMFPQRGTGLARSPYTCIFPDLAEPLNSRVLLKSHRGCKYDLGSMSKSSQGLWILYNIPCTISHTILYTIVYSI